MMENEKSLNPFGTSREVVETVAEEARAVQEVQAALVIAKRFPRDQMAAMDRILQACTRPTLAESALFAYPRGGTTVTGPSIRLAEALAQNWGNISFGIRELSNDKGESIVEAFAWDLETNTKQVKVFSVPHKRYTRAGTKRLDDPRDVYELVANQGARRLRACILGIIPGDVVDSARSQCELTQQNATGVPADEITKLVGAFGDLGVTQEQIRRRLGHDLSATISAEILSLRKIYVSLRDGMSGVKDWFQSEAPEPQSAPVDTVGLKAKLDAARAPKGDEDTPEASPEENAAEKPKKRRGRPRKNPETEETTEGFGATVDEALNSSKHIENLEHFRTAPNLDALYEMPYPPSCFPEEMREEQLSVFNDRKAELGGE